MKRAALFLLIASMLFSLPACSFGKPTQSNTNLVLETPTEQSLPLPAEDTTAAIPTETTLPTEPECTIPVLLSSDKNYHVPYRDLIQDFADLIIYRFSKDFGNASADNFPGMSDTLRNAIPKDSYQWSCMVAELQAQEGATTPSSYGYILYDMNADEIPELFWVDKDRRVVAIFTYFSGNCYLLDAYWSRHYGHITLDNKLCSDGSNGATDHSMTIYALSGGKLFEAYTFRSTYSGSSMKYYVGSTAISEARYKELTRQYADTNPNWLSQPINDLPATERLVQIHRGDFLIFNGPSYDNTPAGTVETANTYTIVAEEKDSEGNLWGKLKSGAGWVDLTLNEKESREMPPVTTAKASRSLLNKDYYYCTASTASYALDISICAHETLKNVSFFAIDVANGYKKGPNLFQISKMDSSRPLVATVYFPGPSSLYGLEFTDRNGKTQVYAISESGRNGSINARLLTTPLSPADAEDNINVNNAEPWKVAYLDYIETLGREKYSAHYSLVYLDSDEIPELFISGSCEASGSIVCSYQNGKVVTTHLRRLGGAAYIPQEGLVHNFNGNMGYYTVEIYQLTPSGFISLFSARQEDTYEEVTNETGETEYVTYSKYYITNNSVDTEVTEEEFNAAQNEVFPFEKAASFDYPGSDFSEIRQMILNWQF